MELFKLVGSIFVKNNEANDRIDDTTKKAKNSASAIGSAMETAGGKLSKVGKALLPVSTAVGGVLAASTKGASTFTDGMAKMSTLFDTSKVSVDDLSSKFIDLSNSLGIGASELAEAGYQALSAGVDVDDSVSFVETAGKLAKAGFTDTATAVDVLTTAMNAYGDDAGTAEEIANKLVRTQNLGKTTVNELATAMGRVIPTAASMNVGVDQLTSGYVSLTKQGIATSEATTYMNSMFNELGNSGTKLGKVIQEKTGMSFQECMESGMSLADVLQITKDYADENGIAYNELYGSAEAGKAGLAILNSGAEEFNATAEIMASDTDDLGSAIDKLKTPSEKIKESWERVKNTGISLGSTILEMVAPTLDKLATGAEKLFNWFDNLSDGTKKVIATVGGIIAVAGPVFLVGGKLIKGVGKVIKVFGMMKKAFGVAKIAIAALSGPVGIVIGVIAGLVGVGVLLYKNWDKIKEKAAALKDWVSEKWNNLKDATTEAWTNLKDGISEKWNSIKEKTSEVVGNIKDTVSEKWNNLKEKTSETWENIKTATSEKWANVKDKVSEFTSNIKDTVSEKWGNIKDKTSEIWGNIKSKVEENGGGIKGVIKTYTDGYKQVWSSAFSRVDELTGGKLGNALSTARDKLDSIKNAFKEKMDTAKTTVSNAIEKIKGFFNFSWSLPHIALPHFSISGRFSLKPPSIPHFSVSWYEKAMNSPRVFTKPTLFDVDPLSGKAKGAGEAGDELMYGKNALMRDISEAVAVENGGIVNVLDACFDKLFDILEEYLPDCTAKQQLVLDTGVLVAETAPMMDERLGIIQKRKGR